jgi:metal-responsive CopG/Arc/MetJ family transcriptional regulator
MKTRSRTSARTAPSVRQSVTIPAQLANEVERVARKKHLTMSRALVVLAQRGVEAEAAARDQLHTTYRRFLSEVDPERKGEAGKDLIRAIFGKDSIAEDSIL